MQIEVVVNCGAGSVDGDDVDAQRTSIEDAFAAHDVEVAVAMVAGEDLAQATTDAVARGADVVVVAGGDGTMGTVADAVAEADAVLGVLPLGTFNHFARDLQIPDDLTEAARVVLEGETATIDLAEVNGRTFVNNSTIGLYPVMVDLRDEIRSSRGWGKVRAVPVASWGVLRRFPTRRLHIEAGEQSWSLRTPFVFVGNNTFEVGPSGIGARTDLTTGELCCFVSTTSSRLGFLRMALHAVTRGSARTPTLDTVCAEEVEVRLHGHRVLVALDGEITTLRAPLRFRSRPAALKVRVPVGSQPLGHPPTGPDAGAGVEQDAG